jgi:nucleoside-diphosphate-sugar epimerase
VKVFVLGGTGAIGSHALPALVAAGHEVSALARTPQKAEAVRAQGAGPVMVSMFDRAALAKAFRGHDAVVNLATSMPSMATFMFRRAWKPTERVRIEGSAAVVDAAHAAGVPRLVQESVSMVYLLGDRMTSLTRSMRVSNQRLREASGWYPRYASAREGWIATAETM